MIEFVWPQTLGEWLAWLSALSTMLFGLWAMVMPRLWLKLLNLRTVEGRPEAVAEMRGPLGGMNFGLGLAVILLHPQPLLYLGLGSALLFMAIGRLVSVFVDKGSAAQNWYSLLFELVMAAFPLLYVFGVIS